jgi:hypothetical protein
VYPVLAVARLRYGQEHQRGEGAVWGRRDHGEELVCAFVDRTLQQPRPEAGDIVGAQRVDDDLAKSHGHDDVLPFLVRAECAIGLFEFDEPPAPRLNLKTHRSRSKMRLNQAFLE